MESKHIISELEAKTFNFREISESGNLYRSAYPSWYDFQTSSYVKMAEIKELNAVINLSDSQLINNNLPEWYQKLIADGNVIALGMSNDFDCISPEFTAQLRMGLQFMILHKGPYLVHCQAGMDRTGFVVAILEAIMEVKFEEIIWDYLVSCINLSGLKISGIHTFPREVQNMLRVQEKKFLNIFRGLNDKKTIIAENFKDVVEKYLLNTVNISVHELACLKENLCEIGDYHR